jgi:hypothetical protein
MGPVNNFFGTGPVARSKKDMDLWRIRIGDSFREALQPSALSPPNAGKQSSDIATSGPVSSLTHGTFVNLGYGIPRIIIYSDMARFFPGLSDRAQARKLGLEKGIAAALNIQGAEVHVIGLSGGAAIHDALAMFFLASRGELVSTGSAASLPRFGPAPVRVTRYQGTIQYPQNTFPIRIRLAIDQNGTLVNSWLSVQTSGEQFSPLHGVVTCASKDSCKYSGDDVFAQVWNVKRSIGGPPFLDPSMPFGGARSLAFEIEDESLKGSISDSLIRFEGLPGNKFEFVTTRQATGLF